MKRLQKLVTCLDAATLKETTKSHSIWSKKRDLFDYGLKDSDQFKSAEIAPLFSPPHDAIPKKVEQTLCTEFERYNQRVFLKKNTWSFTPILVIAKRNYHIALNKDPNNTVTFNHFSI